MKNFLFFTMLTLSFSSYAVEVSSIEVRLFYNGSGTFSEDIIDNKEFILWNTIIGEGSAKEPSDRFYIKVKIAGSVDTYSDETINLLVQSKETGKVLYSEKFNRFLFSKSGTTYRAIMLADYNCEPLIISVGKVSKLLEFHCGE